MGKLLQFPPPPDPKPDSLTPEQREFCSILKRNILLKQWKEQQEKSAPGGGPDKAS